MGACPLILVVGIWLSLEEERRLLYVAMTRAKDNLHLLVPQRLEAQNNKQQGEPTSTLHEHGVIPDRLLCLFDKTTWPLASEPAVWHNTDVRRKPLKLQQ